jgi:hypothetical protein
MYSPVERRERAKKTKKKNIAIATELYTLSPPPSSSSLENRTQRTSQSAILQIIARHKPRPPTITSHNLRLPPPVVLQAQHGEDVAFAERQFFRDGGLVHVHCASCAKEEDLSV